MKFRQVSLSCYPYGHVSCVSAAVSMITGKSPSNITNTILKARLKQGWGKSKALANTEWAYDYEFRPLIKKFTRRTKIVYPKNKKVLDLKNKKGQYIVAIKDHVLLLNGGMVFDVCNPSGCRINNFWDKNLKIYWYQRLTSGRK